MKKLLALAGLLAAFASSAFAAGGVNLYWDDCSVNGQTNRTFACNTNSGASFDLVTSVVLPADMPKFAAAEVTLDLVFSAQPPAWWQFSTGECRSGALFLSFDPVNNASNCGDIWQGSPNLGVFQAYGSGPTPTSRRIVGAAAVPAGSEIALAADGSELWVCRTRITRAKTTGSPACSGCNVAACVFAHGCWLRQADGLGDHHLGAAASNYEVAWQGGLRLPCSYYVPTRNRTWGAVKGMYR